MTTTAPATHGLYRRVLAPHRVGNDPTTLLGSGHFWRATLTPCGAATMHIHFTSSQVEVRAWGPGASWMQERALDWVGAGDSPVRFGPGSHDAILAAQAAIGPLPLSNGHCLYHSLLPTVIAQRVTSLEAARSWRSLCLEFGARAPGPIELRLPPDPEVLGTLPYWRLHPLGIERHRADTLRLLGRASSACFDHDDSSPDRARTALEHLRGIGQWTLGAALGHALGDPDALAVGDYHLKNIVAWALNGRARGSDDEMVGALERYRGQRGRAVRLLLAHGWSAPKFGPRQRIQPIAHR